MSSNVEKEAIADCNFEILSVTVCYRYLFCGAGGSRTETFIKCHRILKCRLLVIYKNGCKSKYLLISLHILIIGCNFGCELKIHPVMNIKRNITFALESRKKNGVLIIENVPIRMRVVFDSHRIEFTTGYRIDVAKWDAKAQRVKNGCTNKLKQSASDINADLLKQYTEIDRKSVV